MGIGERIKLAREEKGWSQEDLATKLGVEPPTISRWETGAHAPRPRQWPLIAKILGHPRDWFEGNEPDRLARLEQRLRDLEKISSISPVPDVLANAWRAAEEWQRDVALFFLTLQESFLDRPSIPDKLKNSLRKGVDFFGLKTRTPLPKR
jgi:transcriptional regulator with XRE-family HTH domain